MLLLPRMSHIVGVSYLNDLYRRHDFTYEEIQYEYHIFENIFINTY